MKPILLYQTINNTSSKETHFIPLLLVTNAETSHYILIKKFNAFMCVDQVGGRYYCHLCFACYHEQKDLNNHLANVHVPNDKPLQMELPSPPNHLMKFISYQKTVKHPFVMIADIECSQVKPRKYTSTINTSALTEHIPSGLGYYYNGIYNYFNENPIVNFVIALENYATEIYKLFKNPKPIPILLPDHPYYTATRCHYCDQPFNENIFNYRKVLDHDHITGEFRCASHSVCNLHVQLKKRLVVFFHNGSHYDWHLLMEEFSKRKYDIKPIPQTDEKYVSVSVYVKFGPSKHDQVEIRFLDSYKFLPKSLDELVSITDKSNLKILSQNFPKEEDFRLLCRKGLYPYQWQTSFSKLLETRELPERNEFYSSLTDSTISEADYDHAKQVYKHFSCDTMLDYHNLYLKSDVLLLADIVDNFREFSLVTYCLDPAYYYTAPNLSLDACLKYTNQTLELITKGNEDMYLLFEKAIRGGISGVGSKRYSKTEEGKCIMDWDANNLYGHSMTQPLPTGNFKWIRKNEVDFDNTMQLLTECYNLYKQGKPITKGYLIQTDLFYPKELHDKHNDLPLAPENIIVQKSYLSASQQENYVEGDINSKLTTNLFDKKKYITFHENLFYYLDEGLRHGTIYNVIQFDQSTWMKPYIELNTKLRMNSKNDFQKEFFKLMNVSVYGKTMENVRNYRNLTICTSPRDFRRQVQKHNYAGSRMLTDSSVIVELKQNKKKFNKPIYVGAKILDLSKLHMYQFWYNNLKQKYQEKIKLLYIDCDSIIAEIYTKDIYKDMLNDIDTFDTSDYPKDHFLYSEKNKKVLGKFKDVLNGVKLESFVALRSKCYAYVTEEDITNAKINGIKKYITNLLTFKQYTDVLFGEEKNHTITQNTIRSKNHNIFTVSQVKAGLRYGDIKRYDLNSVDTLALGHHLSLAQ